MKEFSKNEHADVRMIGGVVALLVTLIVSVLVFYSIAGGVDYTTANEKIAENVYGYGNGVGTDLNGTSSDWEQFNATTPASNASDDTLDQAGTFYEIAPIIAIVIVAVVILGYVGKIQG